MQLKRIAFGIILGLGLALPHRPSAAAEQDAGNQGATPTDEVRHQGRTIAEWINDWKSNNYTTQQTAKRALIAIGAPAAGELAKVIKENSRDSGQAIPTLAEMGPNAKAALPLLLEIASKPADADPQGWAWNVSLRDIVLSNSKDMGWAADQWIPVLTRIAEDPAETKTSRQRATLSLGGMGTAAEPNLRKMSTSANADERKSAINALVTLVEARGGSKNSLLEEYILRNPADTNVPEFLTQMQGRVNALAPQPLTQQVKADLRQRLRDKPDAETAVALATIIRNGLSATEIHFMAPSNSRRAQWNREDPAENYATMAAALEIAFAQAPKDSDLAQLSGRSLARLRLLQGDWDGLNTMLEKLGQAPIPADRRTSLPGPPLDWGNLAQDWQAAHELMREGTSAIEFQFEKEGKPLSGMHVLVKRQADAPPDGRTGSARVVALLQLQPLDSLRDPLTSFNPPNRAMTRYGISDASGKVRIERLPAIPIVVEVLVPTGNFAEPGRNWDLLMETAPGELRPTGMEGNGLRGGPRGRAVRGPIDDRPQLEPVSRQAGPAVVELKENETLIYPKFVVRPQLVLSVTEWSSVDPNDFVLWWGAVTGEEAFDHYEVEMMLTAPGQHPDLIATQRVIRSTSEQSIDTRWPVGQKGVGGQRLRPGNIYMFEVRAIGHDGKVLARLPRTRVWTPWPHRQSQPPQHDSRGALDGLPFYDQMWWRTGVQVAGNPRVDNRERIAEYLPKSADRFEYEYVQLGKAWLQCLDGATVDGRPEIERLARDLPKGNIVRGTARALLIQLDGGGQLPNRLDFVEDQ